MGSQANVACDQIFFEFIQYLFGAWKKLDSASTYGAGVTWNLINVSNKIVLPTVQQFGK